MKRFFHVALTSLLLFLFSSFNAQNTGILKSFINKNDFILRSVQKNTIRLADTQNEEVVRSILKLQLISIKFHETNVELSKQAAHQARQEGLIFLQKNATVPKTFETTEKEKSYFGKQEPIVSPDKHLSASELQSVTELEAKNPDSFNAFIITINN